MRQREAVTSSDRFAATSSIKEGESPKATELVEMAGATVGGWAYPRPANSMRYSPGSLNP